MLAVAGLIWLLAGTGFLVLSEEPDADLARRLESRGVTVTAIEVREELSRRNARRELDVTFTTVDGERVTAGATGFSRVLAEYEPRDRWNSVWRAGSYQYAAPLEVVYDPQDPQQVMARTDIAGHADGAHVHTVLVNVAIATGALVLAVVIWLLAVAVRVLRRR
nr:DUF3592 domain-containing protein [Blastococcus atacamensis]